MKVIRGAVCAENTKSAIADAAVELVSKIMEKNALSPADIECVFFSATPDLTAANPATAARNRVLPDCQFMCFSEMAVEGAMPKVLRAAIFVSKDISPKHCYLGAAAALRPDIDIR